MRNKKLMFIFSVLCALALISVLTSALFSVRHVETYCYNADDTKLEELVKQNSGIKLGESIFLLNKQEVIDRLKESIPNIENIQIEKKFPNRVYINYVKIEEYYKVLSGGRIYCLTKNGSLTRVLDEEATDTQGLIELRLNGEATGEEFSGEFLTDNPKDIQLMQALLPAMEMLLLREDLQLLFEFVDLTQDFVYLKTRTGLFWELQSTENIYPKLKLALDTYITLASTGSDMTKTGTLILTWRNGVPNADYNSSDRYTNGV